MSAADVDHLDVLISKISTVEEDATLPEVTEQNESHFTDCVNKNICDSEEALSHTDSHTVEIVNHDLFAHCDWSNEQSTCKFLMLADTVPVVKNEFEQSVDKSDDFTGVIVDYDDEPDVAEKRVLIDSVFFACDPNNTGSVAVSDVIIYLRDTLHVINYLCFLRWRKNIFCSLA